MDPIAILALIGDLYGQIGELRRENEALKQQLHAQQSTPPASSNPMD